ncbi:type I restriction endonuclease subunit R [Nostocaceae cyanobacterium CENA369]|uniref:type I site-specific deoxyribonuclease n=1 Tax=Dendronalium phyllosphericum CENA369 TaxID=1725256 RepID=A0A8J7I142_9NOST|nr:type I restriction endonuclease [Dendronalium phyllosphericum]MBH8572635.1 type I restriction endonuclease subunit R [Dendronalium phyllosphericum CENA369]
MNPAQIGQITVRASRVARKLRRFDLRQFATAPLILTWFEVLGYTVLLEPDIALGKHQIGRSSYSDVVLYQRLHEALQKINPTKPQQAIAKAIHLATCPENSDLLENNYRFHKFLSDGIEVEYLYNKEIVRDKVWLTDTSNLLNNDWLVIHPLTVVEGNYAHCVDVVVFINGLPLAVIVSINPNDGQATFKAGKERIQTYFQQIPKLFYYNTLLVITCGNRARVGTLTSDWQEFLPWHTIDGEAVEELPKGFPGISKLPLASALARNERHPEGEDFTAKGATELEVLIQGIFDKRRFLEQDRT